MPSPLTFFFLLPPCITVAISAYLDLYKSVAIYCGCLLCVPLESGCMVRTTKLLQQLLFPSWGSNGMLSYFTSYA
ncbi:hypothetical protein PILCRDRAFT_826591 [Piloderma croceum F 1598]|uniref:Uncharacterized protein n=1 Tax=Piloderma croceum (strain F 1598) TaxID=765440 RepID=A0A0C3F8N1_PILCF|nr:hypothetical protein PILCRDRAFT_826591 [Piloderma croceum F 1598]